MKDYTTNGKHRSQATMRRKSLFRRFMDFMKTVPEWER